MLTKQQLIAKINDLEVEKIKLMGQVEYIDQLEKEKAEEAKTTPAV
jgi:hypothetical protein